MDIFKSKEIKDKSVWEKFLLSKSPKSFLQTWNWGEVNIACGSNVVRIGFYRRSKLVGIAQFVEQKAKRGKHFLVPGGPIIDWKDKKLFEQFKSYALLLCKETGAWFVRIRPEIYDSADSKSFFRQMGFVPSPMHLNAENTWVLDISRPDDELLSGMRKTTRYLIKKAVSDPEFTIEKTSDSKKTAILERLQKDTVVRHRFVGFSGKLFSEQIKNFGPDGQAVLYTAKYKGRIHAAAIIIYYGDTAYYHHSASSNKSKEFPIAYLMQWQIIKDARSMGLKYYNFWGIAPEGQKKHRFYGVTIFKKGFGGEAVNWLHAQDLVYSNKYYFTYVFETLRRIFRHL